MPYNKSEQAGAAPMRRRPMHRKRKLSFFYA